MDIENFSFSSKYLVGSLVRTTRGSCVVKNIELPQDSSITVVRAQDLGENTIKVHGYLLDVMADNFSSYKGQVVLAVFGESFESVNAYINKIEITYEDSEEKKAEVVYRGTLNKGEDCEVVSSFASTFTVDRHAVATLDDITCMCQIEDGVTHVQVPSQWPFALKENVEALAKKDGRKVVLHEKKYHAIYNQLIFTPIQLAQIAYTACKKSGKCVKLCAKAYSFSPQITFEIETGFDAENQPVFLKALARADVGKNSIYEDELCTSIIAGLFHPYGIKKADITVEIVKSQNPVSCFFIDYGFGCAMGAIENHFTQFGLSKSLFPSSWRLENFRKGSLFSSIKKCSVFDQLKNTCEDCCRVSSFDRLYSTNLQFKGNVEDPILNYKRGVGLSSGTEAEGFSTRFKFLTNYNLGLTFTSKNKLSVNLPICLSFDEERYFTSLLEKNLNLRSDDISFTGIDLDNIEDFGPDTPGRMIHYIPTALRSICENVQITDETKYPLRLNWKQEAFSSKCFFNSNSCGSIVVYLHIDNVMLVPVVDRVYANLRFEKIFNKATLQMIIKQIITSTISEICPCANNSHAIELEINEDGNGFESCGICLVRGLVIGSFISALSQALNHNINRIPITEYDMLNMVTQEGVKDEVKPNG